MESPSLCRFARRSQLSPSAFSRLHLYPVAHIGYADSEFVVLHSGEDSLQEVAEEREGFHELQVVASAVPRTVKGMAPDD